MTHRLFRRLASIILVCVFLPTPGLAQVPPPPDPSAAPPQYLPVPMANPPVAGPPQGNRRLDWEAAAAVGNSWGGSTILGYKGDWVFGAAAGPGVGPYFGPGYWCTGWPYGPRVAPPWGYPFLPDGPFVTYPPFIGPYSGRSGSTWSNGLSLYGPPVPTYGPIPGVFGNDDLRRQW